MLIVALFYLLSSFVIIKFYTSNYGRKIFLIHRDSKLCISICPTCQMCVIIIIVCLQCVNRYLCYVELRHLVREMYIYSKLYYIIIHVCYINCDYVVCVTWNIYIYAQEKIYSVNNVINV